MKNKFYIIAILLNVILVQHLFSQKLNIGMEIGYHWYKMEDLKYLNNWNLNTIPFKAQITENYPAYYNYSPFIIYNFSKKIGLGFRYTFNSTGSRISRKDYSGEYEFDSKIKGNAFSLISTINIKEYDKFSVNYLNDLGIIYSKLNLKENIVVYDVGGFKDENSYSSRNYYWDPSFSIIYPVYILNLSLRLGYQFDFNKGDLTNDAMSWLKLYKTLGNNLKSNWSGMHFNLSISVPLGFKKETKKI